MSATEQQAQDLRYYRRVLHELIDRGADLARDIHRLADDQAELLQVPQTAATPDFTIAFDCITRTIRRTVALALELDEPAGVHASAPGTAERPRIIRADLLSRVDAPDLDDEITDRPIEEIIREICRDLGIDPWKGVNPAELTDAGREPKTVIPMRPSAARTTERP